MPGDGGLYAVNVLQYIERSILLKLELSIRYPPPSGCSGFGVPSVVQPLGAS